MSYQDEFDRCKKEGWLILFAEASAKYHIALEVLLAQCSRETGGIHNIPGDSGHGRGLMQIDDRWHGSWLKAHMEGFDPASNIDYAASLLASEVKYFNALDAGLAAYNSGRGNVKKAIRKGFKVDHYTAHGDYSKDVLERAKEFKKLLEAEHSKPTEGK